LYFVALDGTDLVTRKTGLTGFTVYRSRKGGAATAMTTPTVIEVDATNMPGVYALLVDEDTTVDSGSDSEEMVLHLTATGMAPVTRTVELYRRDVTSGRSVAVDANGRVDVSLIEGVDATDQLDAHAGSSGGATAAEIATAVWTDLLAGSDFSTSSSIGKLLKDNVDAAISSRLATSGYTAPLDAAGVRSAVGMASANLDTQLSTIAGYIDTEVAAIKAKTDNLPSDPADQSAVEAAITAAQAAIIAAVPSSAQNADAVWDEAVSGHVGVGSFGKLINDDLDATVSSRLAASAYTAPDNAGVAAIKAKTDNLPTDPADASVIAGRFDTLDTSIADLPTNAELATALAGADDAVLAAIAALNNLSQADVRTAVGLATANLDTQLSTIAGYIDTEVAAIKAKTDNLPASPAAVSDIPSAASIAAAVFNSTVENSYSLLELLKAYNSVLLAAWTKTGSSVVYRDLANTKDRVTATIGATSRSVATLDLT
jgi:hypothetical protein